MINLKSRLQQPEILLAPGVYDALSALMAEQAGFEAVYISGASVAYTTLGRSDVGLTTFTEVNEKIVQMRDRISLPIIVDADTGETLSPLAAFLTHAALEAGEHQAEVGADALQLMTVHSAKGLEFHTVFITGLEGDLFPHVNSATDNKGLEEERRLMYVALTRARRHLYLTYAMTRRFYDEVRSKTQSLFLQELPQHLLKPVNSFRQPSTHVRQRAAIYGTAPLGSQVNATASVLRAQGLPWRIGQEVRHAKFGAGVIVNAEGAGADARVQVNFKESGLKWLALAYARLEAA